MTKGGDKGPPLLSFMRMTGSLRHMSQGTSCFRHHVILQAKAGLL